MTEREANKINDVTRMFSLKVYYLYTPEILSLLRVIKL